MGQNGLFQKELKSYEIAPTCKTGAHLLDYYQRVEKDQRIVEYFTPFADSILMVINERGIIPSFVSDDMTSSNIHYESAQPAAAIWFLVEMFNVTKQRKYLQGAEKIAVYLEKEIIPSA